LGFLGKYAKKLDIISSISQGKQYGENFAFEVRTLRPKAGFHGDQ
jgi:hypothetical protein